MKIINFRRNVNNSKFKLGGGKSYKQFEGKWYRRFEGKSNLEISEGVGGKFYGRFEG